MKVTRLYNNREGLTRIVVWVPTLGFFRIVKSQAQFGGWIVSADRLMPAWFPNMRRAWAFLKHEIKMQKLHKEGLTVNAQ